jgi:hypothetical protein
MIRGLLLILLMTVDGTARVYEVGPGRALVHVNDVPWESLEPGDDVRIHRRAEAYRAKFVLCRQGLPDQPIRVTGVPDREGRLPVIDGRDATTRKALNFWGEDRAVIKVGGANRPADTMPAHLIVSNLEIRSGRRPYSFSGRDGRKPYRKNAASIYLEKGEHITIENCRLYDSGNGIITGPATTDLIVRGCHIFNNGVEKSLYEHNAYISALRVTFEFNRFGPLRPDCLGSNFKDRSAGLRFRCNWVEGGNRCLDLVDAAEPHLNGDPLYAGTAVWGNVLIKGARAGNNQVVHFGGDSGRTAQYRRGKFWFHNNTVVSPRRGNTVLFRISAPDVAVDCRNNIVQVSNRAGRLNLLADGGWRSVTVERNWLSRGWRESPGRNTQAAFPANLSTADPGFVAGEVRDFRLSPESACGRFAGKPNFGGWFGDSYLAFQYRPHQRNDMRPDISFTGPHSLGAFGRAR